MTNLLSKYNHYEPKFNVNVEGFSYANLRTLFDTFGADEVYSVDGFYFCDKQRYPSYVVFCADKKLKINMPTHMNNTYAEMMQDDELVQMINEGKVGFTIRTYQANGRECYGVTFVNK